MPWICPLVTPAPSGDLVRPARALLSSLFPGAPRYDLLLADECRRLLARPGTIGEERALNGGLVPAHYDSGDAPRLLEAYVGDHPPEEIAAEGVTRNVPALGRFMEVAALSNGQIANYTSTARECGVSAPTVSSYFGKLEETLVGGLLQPFARRGRLGI